MITEAFLDMLYLFSCGAHGVLPKIQKINNFQDVLLHAKEQGIINVIYPPAKELFSQGLLDIDEESFKAFKHYTMASIMADTNRRLVVKNLLETLQKNEIDFCILKGDTLSVLYNTPQTRISSDTDIFVGQQGFKKALSVLKDQGFEIEPIVATSHHAIAHHSIAGRIEIHRFLHDELVEDAWFNNEILICQPFRQIHITDQIVVPALGVTDGMIYVALHYIKHFLEDGVGIRQLMDTLLYMRCFRNEIDWNRFLGIMNRLKYSKFISHSIGIGIRYLGFSDKELMPVEYNEGTIDKLLCDFAEGGIFGKNTSLRKGFYLQYTKLRISSSKNEDYRKYIKKWWKPNIIPIIFPSYKHLVKKFRYLEKSRLIYPVAWIHRMWLICIDIFSGKKKISQLISPVETDNQNYVLKRRIELVQELEMI